MSSPKLTPVERQILVDNANQYLLSGPNDGYNYLVDRGITNETINACRLGYVPDYVNNYWYAGRIIIPYYDAYGGLISVAARKIVNEKPYWVNDIFDKKNHLFGLDKAKKSIKKNNLAIIVEGQFDFLTLWQSRIKNVVAICSASVSDYHIVLLARYTDRIVLIMDGDDNPAVKKATDNNFKKIKDKNEKTWKVTLSNNEDPDSYVRRFGAKKLYKKIKENIK